MPSDNSMRGTTPAPSVASNPSSTEGNGTPARFNTVPTSAAQNGGTRASRSQGLSPA